LIQLSGISKSYGEGQVLNHISLQVKEGEILSIIGPSGSGKTTLLNIMSGVLEATHGQVISEASQIGYVFQEDRLVPWLTTEENIRFVAESIESERLSYLIKTMGLQGAEDKRPDEMSGGMRQRASIARAFAYEPDLLLMDEPFKSIDYYLKGKIINALIQVWVERMSTVVFVTHDVEEAIMLADRIIVLGRKPAVILNEIKIQSPRNVDEEAFLKIKKEITNCWEEIK